MRGKSYCAILTPYKNKNPVLIRDGIQKTRGTTLFPRNIRGTLFRLIKEPSGHINMPSSLVTADGSGQVYLVPFPSGHFGWQLRRDFQRVRRVRSHHAGLAGRHYCSYSSPSTPLHAQVYHFGPNKSIHYRNRYYRLCNLILKYEL